jgi:hypothetical protein
MAWLWSGCAAKVMDNSQLQYLAPEFTENSLAEHGLSLLPIVAGHGQEGLRRPLGAKLDSNLTNQLPDDKFIGTIQTLDLINEANLTEAYAQMIDDYAQAAILNKSTLRRIGEAIGIRYLLHVKLLDQSHTETIGPALLSDDIINRQIKNVSIFGQVWDCHLGDVVWEGTGDVAVQTEVEVQYIKHSIEDLVNIAARSFLNNLPGINIPKAK